MGYSGGSTAAYDVIKEVRAKAKRFVMLFEALPGEFSQHDFGSVWITFTDGSRKRVKFFGTRLKYSRWAEVTLVEDETAETIVRTLVRHFENIGGIPLLAVFDRPKTIAVKWLKDGTVTQWNETFAKVMFELGIGVANRAIENAGSGSMENSQPGSMENSWLGSMENSWLGSMENSRRARTP